MGITFTAPPLVRFLSWFGHRSTLCMYCHKVPKLDGENYCSENCADEDAELQIY